MIEKGSQPLFHANRAKNARNVACLDRRKKVAKLGADREYETFLRTTAHKDPNPKPKLNQFLSYSRLRNFEFCRKIRGFEADFAYRRVPCSQWRPFLLKIRTFVELLFFTVNSPKTNIGQKARDLSGALGPELQLISHSLN